jgi:hypothetical protein
MQATELNKNLLFECNALVDADLDLVIDGDPRNVSEYGVSVIDNTVITSDDESRPRGVAVPGLGIRQ